MFYSVKNTNIFKNKTIIITETTGSKVMVISVAPNIRVGISYDIPTNPSHFKIISSNRLFKNLVLILKISKTKKIILKPSQIPFFHLAAQS